MRPVFFLMLLVVLAGISAGPATAQRGAPDSLLPLDRVLAEVRRAHPGEFYDADGPRRGADGQDHYRLKWMTPGGRIEWLDADARTGRVLGASPGPQNANPRMANPRFNAPGFAAPFSGRGGGSDFRANPRRGNNFQRRSDDGGTSGPGRSRRNRGRR